MPTGLGSVIEQMDCPKDPGCSFPRSCVGTGRPRRSASRRTRSVGTWVPTRERGNQEPFPKHSCAAATAPGRSPGYTGSECSRYPQEALMATWRATVVVLSGLLALAGLLAAQPKAMTPDPN